MCRLTKFIALTSLLILSTSARAEPDNAADSKASKLSITTVELHKPVRQLILLPSGGTLLPTRHLTRYACASGAVLVCTRASRGASTSRCVCD
jgi:hypothetical protein